MTETEQYVDIHMAMANREFDGHQVLHTLNEHDVTYLTPKKKYTDDHEGVSKVEEHPISDVGVEPAVELWLDGERSHEVNFMYVPSRNEDGKYTVFLTNREGVEPEDVHGLCARYDRQWEIENEYKQIKKFLPTHASTDYRVRAFSFVFGCLLYNVWRLTDYLLKLELRIPIRDKPLLTAGETIELLACLLVPGGQLANSILDAQKVYSNSSRLHLHTDSSKSFPRTHSTPWPGHLIKTLARITPLFSLSRL